MTKNDNSKKTPLEKKLLFERRFCWEEWDKAKVQKAFAFADDYRKFLSNSKTERLVVRNLITKAEDKGFKQLENQKAKPGLKVYRANREKNLALAVFGQKPMGEGIRMIFAHADSPHLGLKITPLYEEEKVAFLKTHYYGGIKKYQWPATPLALYGTVVLKNGKKIEIGIGDGEDDPIFIITDLLPHLAKKQLEKKLEEAIVGEELNVIIGSLPIEDKKPKGRVKLGVLDWLNKKYGLVESDLISADLHVVPAGQARDLGIDRGLMAGFGHDDRCCCFAATESLFEAETPPLYTCVVALLDKEETGSESNTGAASSFVKDFVAGLLALENPKANENDLRDLFSITKAISADVASAIDPDYRDVYDPRNDPRLGAGVVLEKTTGARGRYFGNDASAEYVGWLRQVFDKKNVIWQPGTIGKIDVGGGGTVAIFFARHNIDVIDLGPALWNMHAPWEILSKADLFASFEAYQAFLAAS